MNLLKISSAVLMVLAFCVAQAQETKAQPQIQFSDGSIAAKPEYHGDYFTRPNGETVKLYRKKNVFVMPQGEMSRMRSKKAALDSHIKTSKGRMLKATKHQLKGAYVVRVKDNNKSASSSFSSSSASLKASFPDLQPVFTTESGKGDLMLLNTITIRVDEQADPLPVLENIERRFNVRVVRKLNVSGQVYSLEFKSGFTDPNSLFSVTRKITNLTKVRWAEPQFYMQAQKSSFTPNDALYAQQWHLQNRGFRGSRCDADCDANNAWGLGAGNGAGSETGVGVIIAIIDDGVQLNHPDLVANIDNINGRDFVDDSNTLCGDDGTPGVDNDPSPSPVQGCEIAGDSIEPDNHGTAVAGLAAAKGNNSIGVAGVAFNSTILPIRAISEYESATQGSTALCDRLAEAVEYAAQKADVLNLSWNLPFECTALTEAIEKATNGTVTAGSGSKRANGSPVIVASGNNASGWVKVTVPVSAGEHAYEWRFLRSDFPDSFFQGEDTVWIDDIQWPDGSNEGFESFSNFSTGDFSTDWVLNQCNAECTSNFGGEPVWGINTIPEFVRSGSRSARLNVFNSDCGNSYLHTLREGPAGDMSFWVWVSADTQTGQDKFELLIDGEEALSYGDLGAFGFVNDPVGYPANLSDASTSTEAGVIAVGASTSGDLSGNATAASSVEYRAPYSQFGPTLDVVAPSSDQHLGITTTDRTGSRGYSSGSYTDLFTGTSASAAMVSGVAAAIIASDPGNDISASNVKTIIRNSADEIGTIAYSSGRNDYYGHGRVNMFNAVSMAISGNYSTKPSAPSRGCAVQGFDYLVSDDLYLARFEPQPILGSCPAQGPLPGPMSPPAEDQVCFAVKTKSGGTALICI